MIRYSQQIIVPEMGKKGQEKIQGAKVLVIGAGGLGTPLLTYLTSAGIGHIGIVDGDTVQSTNLHRQFLYNENDIGKLKTDILQQRLEQQNSAVSIHTIAEFITEQNARLIIEPYDIICDCTDNVDARIIVANTSAELQKPLVYGAVRDWEGYVTVLNHKNKIRLEDIFPFEQLRENAGNNCSSAGIVNTTCGIAGSIMANEVIKLVVGGGDLLDGEILCFSGLNNGFRKLKIKQP